jgi:DNA-binding helix-hairpin-helix protein with protein kinase domain
VSAIPGNVVDENGRIVALSKLLGRGGEGSVYEVTNDPNIAAKIYIPDRAKARREKILAMVQASLHAGAPGVAYPIGPLYYSGGVFAGFTMQKVGKRRPIHELYSPSSRRQQFARANFPFLIHAALNVANSVAAVHASGCIIGDINHSGILVSQDAIASLIDADSFQFRFHGNIYRCAVGVPDFTPPELQGGRLDQVDRTANHDAFGLAVMIFQMLFMGRHPFVGGFKAGGDMPMEQAISECRFAYSSDQARTRMEPPPHVPSLEDIPPELMAAFEAAFSPKSLKGGRPTAGDWCRLLKSAETQLVRCQSSPAHHHFRNAKACPWCRMERGFPGFHAFAGGVPIDTATPVDLSQLIAAIRAVSDPGIAPPLVASMPAVPVTPAVQPKSDNNAQGFIVATIGAMACIPLGTSHAVHPLLAFVGFGGCAFLALREPTAQSAQQQSTILREGFRRHEEHYRGISDNRRFVESRQKSEAEIREIGNLGNVEARLMAELSGKLRDLQLRSFLEKYQIAHAKIKGLGNTRKATLRSYGIETAADVEKYAIERISGFGPGTSALLIAWRRFHENKFVFNPHQPINPTDIARVKSQVAHSRARLEQSLRSRLDELRQISAEIRQNRSTTVGHAAVVWKDLKQSEANERAVPALGNLTLRRWLFGSVAIFTFILCANYDPNRQMVNRSTVPVASTPSLGDQIPSAVPKPSTTPSLTSQNPPPQPQASERLPEPSAKTTLNSNSPQLNVPSPAFPRTEQAAAPPKPPPPPSATSPGEISNPTVPTTESPPTTLEPPSSAPAERSDPMFINGRLRELGYLIGNPRAGSVGIRQAVREFKIVNGLGTTDEIDGASIRALNAGNPISKSQSFIGGWSSIETCVDGAQLRVTVSQANTDGGVCRFSRVTFIGGGWKIQARCQVNAETWPANISFSVIGRRLDWSSERGHESYYRCQ